MSWANPTSPSVARGTPWGWCCGCGGIITPCKARWRRGTTFRCYKHLYDWPRPDAGEIPTQRILRAAFTISPTSLTVDRVDAVQWWALPRVYMKRFFEQNFDFGEPAKPGSRSR